MAGYQEASGTPPFRNGCEVIALAIRQQDVAYQKIVGLGFKLTGRFSESLNARCLVPCLAHCVTQEKLDELIILNEQDARHMRLNNAHLSASFQRTPVRHETLTIISTESIGDFSPVGHEPLPPPGEF
jgi:hypothetical protein